MEAFIRGIGNISPQETWDQKHFLEEVRSYATARLQSVEPSYRDYINPMQLRRMSRLLKMGVTAAGICLKDAGVEKPDAIITGTGLGMMEETEKFLNGLLDNDEKTLNPTPFIQSTHNTVGAHIAVMLGCNHYNLTYVHGPVSFENALLDALMRLDDDPKEKILVGGVEEITESHFVITDSMDFWKKGEIDSLKLFQDPRPGTIAGEGAAFFLLTREAAPENYARIAGLQTRFNPHREFIAAEFAAGFLAAQGLKPSDIGLLLLGMNGDPLSDAVYSPVRDIFSNIPQAGYKHLCGEHYLSSSFALWMAARILREGHVPAGALISSREFRPHAPILIYHHHQNIHHSLVLVTPC